MAASTKVLGHPENNLLTPVFIVRGRVTEGSLQYSVSSCLNSLRYSRMTHLVVLCIENLQVCLSSECRILSETIRNRCHTLPFLHHLNDTGCKTLLILLSVPVPIATQTKPASGCSVTLFFTSNPGHRYE